MDQSAADGAALYCVRNKLLSFMCACSWDSSSTHSLPLTHFHSLSAIHSLLLTLYRSLSSTRRYAGPDNGRFNFDAVVKDVDLEFTFLPAWKASVSHIIVCVCVCLTSSCVCVSHIIVCVRV